MDFWLTSDVFSWVTSVETANVSHGREWFRAYEIWEHANLILQQEGNEFDLIDAITTLKRAVDHRLRLLNKLYKLKKIPIKEKPSGRLQLLHYMDIVRPIMVDKLIQIRDAVEHEDASPPDYEACKVFSEFVWYFLRSTDNLVREIVVTFNLYPAKSELNMYSVGCGIGIEQGWKPTIGGWLPSQLISDESRDSWLRITGEKFDKLSDYLANSQGSHPDEGDQIEENGPKPEVTYFKGEIRGPADCLKRLIRLYFKVV
ncbi:MAG: hypothetical protein U9O53_04925 [archaeon]|nr:hypothetical protein [archaeon]